MRCHYCDHEFKITSFAYKGRQVCPKCGTVYQIHFPEGVGLIPIVIAFVPALYSVMVLKYALIVGLSFFILFYWAIDIIMNILLIYYDRYELEEIND